jgi:hypothetical protein
MVLMIPTFPLPNPRKVRDRITINKDRENPNTRLNTIVKKKPVRMTGFRPTRSESQTHGTPVRNWAHEKAADVTPTHVEISFRGTPRLWTNSGCR